VKLVLITEALKPPASIVTLWVIVNPVLYPPESWTAISPPGSTTVRAWLKERQGCTAEHGLVSLPVVDTKARGTVGTAASHTPESKSQTNPLAAMLNSKSRLVIVVAVIVLISLSVSIQEKRRPFGGIKMR
jgi:hypothetical protein